MDRRATCIASPSLALIKYWGKQEEGVNVPATSSLAITLGGMETRTICVVQEGGQDRIVIDGTNQRIERFAPFFDNLRAFLCRSLDSSETLYHTEDPSTLRFSVTTSNNFPTAAGTASSSSGFAALAGACTAAVGLSLPTEELSALARIGSGSAARSVLGGFVSLPAGALHATQVHPENWWPELRVVVVIVRRERKDWSSRDAMEHCRATSPYYSTWIDSSEEEFANGLRGLENRDLVLLGTSMRRSYLRMFSTMFAADPPILYWMPESLSVIHACAALRSRGVAAWETMDAGPQVKILTLENDVAAVKSAVTSRLPEVELVVASAGSGLRYEETEGP